MTALSDFLLARLDDDEAVAINASPRSTSWDVVFRGPTKWGDPMPDAEVLAGGKPILVADPEYCGVNELEHVVTFDPARIVAECEAKRQLVEAWQAADRAAGGYPGTDAGIVQGLEEAMVYLALPYADHIDYREEWKP